VMRSISVVPEESCPEAMAAGQGAGRVGDLRRARGLSVSWDFSCRVGRCSEEMMRRSLEAGSNRQTGFGGCSVRPCCGRGPTGRGAGIATAAVAGRPSPQHQLRLPSGPSRLIRPIFPFDWQDLW
jgi:hypothetical protein